MKGSSNIFDSGPDRRNPDTISTALLADVQGNGQNAWKRMVHIYAPLVYHWCRRESLQPVDAEDVTQEVFRAVASRVGEFRRDRPGTTFRGWLRTIARHKIWDFNRREVRRLGRSNGADWENVLADPAVASDGQAETASEEIQLVYTRIADWIRDEFREITWRAFFRVVVDGASPRDVGSELGISINAVYLAKSRVLRRVRNELQELEDRIPSR